MFVLKSYFYEDVMILLAYYGPDSAKLEWLCVLGSECPGFAYTARRLERLPPIMSGLESQCMPARDSCLSAMRWCTPETKAWNWEVTSAGHFTMAVDVYRPGWQVTRSVVEPQQHGTATAPWTEVECGGTWTSCCSERLERKNWGMATAAQTKGSQRRSAISPFLHQFVLCPELFFQLVVWHFCLEEGCGRIRIKFTAKPLLRPNTVCQCNKTEVKSTLGLYQWDCLLNPSAVPWFLHHLYCCISEKQSLECGPKALLPTYKTPWYLHQGFGRTWGS